MIHVIVIVIVFNSITLLSPQRTYVSRQNMFCSHKPWCLGVCFLEIGNTEMDVIQTQILIALW